MVMIHIEGNRKRYKRLQGPDIRMRWLSLNLTRLCGHYAGDYA